MRSRQTIKKRITAGLLFISMVGTLCTLSADSSIAYAATTAEKEQAILKNSSISTFTDRWGTASDKLVTWNKIDSQADYEEFIRLTERDGGVPILLVFTDLVNGQRYVIGGDDMHPSQDTSLSPVINWVFEGDYSNSNNDYTNKMSYMICSDEDGNDTNAVQLLSEITDGFSALANGEDHVVTMGGKGSFTAVADKSTADEEDFNLLVNSSKGETSYLECQEGYPLWWWDVISGWYDDYYCKWELPDLSVNTISSGEVYNSNRINSVPYSENFGAYTPKEVERKTSGSWKLSNWASSPGSGGRKWDTLCIYQEAQLPGLWKQGHFEDFSTMCSNGEFQYAYTVLVAQNHNEYGVFSAAEWVSKKPLSYYDGPEWLYAYNSSNTGARVVGGPRRSNSPFDMIQKPFWMTCGFEVYYGVEGISYSALYGDNGYSGNANSILSDNNVASAYYIDKDRVIESPTGSDAAAMADSIYTVSKNEVVVIPKGVQLTVEEGATLVVSSGGVLVLNGGILNKGLVLVQAGGMILRYDTGTLSSWVNYFDNTLILDFGNVLVSSTNPYNSNKEDSVAWNRNSCLVCDGGNLIVRKNGRIRVTNLGFASTDRDGNASASLTSKKGVTYSFYQPKFSENGSTILNYGYIRASTFVAGNEARCIFDGGCLRVGDDFSMDMLQSTDINQLKSLGLTYIGLNGAYCDIIKKNGALTEFYFE